MSRGSTALLHFPCKVSNKEYLFRFIVLSFLPCFLFVCVISTSAASTSAPVVSPDLQWSVVSSSEDSVSVETVIYGGTLYSGDFSGNYREYVGGSGYDIPYSDFNLHLTLDLGGLTTYPGLYIASNVNVSISCIPQITLRSNGASFTLTDPSANGEVMWGYGLSSGFYFEDRYTELSARGAVSSLHAEWNAQTGKNWFASYVTWQWTFEAPSDTPVGVSTMDVVCPIVVRLTGSPDVMEPYITGNVVGDAIWDGLQVDNTLSNFAPTLDLMIDIDGDGTSFIVNVLNCVRRIPWVQSALIMCCTWAVIGLVVWRK